MNQLSLTGKLGRDPELKYVQGSGKAVCNFSLAVKRPFSKDATDWFDVVLWDKTAEFAANNLKKGETVVVYGYVYIDTWEKDGVKQQRTKVTGQVEKVQWDNQVNNKPSKDTFDDDFHFDPNDTDSIPF